MSASTEQHATGLPPPSQRSSGVNVQGATVSVDADDVEGVLPVAPP